MTRRPVYEHYTRLSWNVPSHLSDWPTTISSSLAPQFLDWSWHIIGTFCLLYNDNDSQNIPRHHFSLTYPCLCALCTPRLMTQWVSSSSNVPQTANVSSDREEGFTSLLSEGSSWNIWLSLNYTWCLCSNPGTLSPRPLLRSDFSSDQSIDSYMEHSNSLLQQWNILPQLLTSGFTPLLKPLSALETTSYDCRSVPVS